MQYSNIASKGLPFLEKSGNDEISKFTFDGDKRISEKAREGERAR